MNVAHLPLMPPGISFRDRKFRLLKDRHLFDTETIAAADLSKDFFLTGAAKKKSQAIFTGDKSLVKEANLFLCVNHQAEIRTRVLTLAEWKAFFGKGSFRFDIIVPETVTVDEDNLSAIAPGPDVYRRVDAAAAATDQALPFDRSYIGRRTFLVGANKIVPGGRAIEYSVRWEEVGGNGLTAAADLRIIFGGGEYEPQR